MGRIMDGKMVSQSSYFKSRPDLVTLGGGELGGGT